MWDELSSFSGGRFSTMGQGSPSRLVGGGVKHRGWAILSLLRMPPGRTGGVAGGRGGGARGEGGEE